MQEAALSSGPRPLPAQTGPQPQGSATVHHTPAAHTKSPGGGLRYRYSFYDAIIFRDIGAFFGVNVFLALVRCSGQNVHQIWPLVELVEM